MTGMKSFRHFGVYGVCERAGKMLVIHKGKGPYTGRYDLPGGRLEDNESLLKGLEREFMEETGLSVKANNNLGTFDFFVHYSEEAYTHMHHIAAVYAVEIIGNEEPQELAMFEGQDSLGESGCYDKKYALILGAFDHSILLCGILGHICFNEENRGY